MFLNSSWILIMRKKQFTKEGIGEQLPRRLIYEVSAHKVQDCWYWGDAFLATWAPIRLGPSKPACHLELGLVAHWQSVHCFLDQRHTVPSGCPIHNFNHSRLLTTLAWKCGRHSPTTSEGSQVPHLWIKYFQNTWSFSYGACIYNTPNLNIYAIAVS